MRTRNPSSGRGGGVHPIDVDERGTKTGDGRRIVLTCVGSLGDLHPYLAIAQELARRGHRPLVATIPHFRERVQAAGIEFHPLRASTHEEPSPELIRRVFDGSRGIEYIVRELILPSLRTAYEDTCAAAAGADLLVSHPLTFATRLVAETRALPWISTQLAPLGMSSALDPPLLPGLRWLHRWRGTRFGPAAWQLLFRLADRGTRAWMRPYENLQTQLGLRDIGNPLFVGSHSPYGELALFSPRFSAPQADWPRQTVATGFPFFDQPTDPDPVLDAWLDAGPPPVIFTLGSSAVWAPGQFFRESALAAQRIGRRALLPGAKTGDLERLGDMAPERLADVFACPYGSYARIFPRSAAVVHQGGIGTTAEALRAGRPMLVVPFGADQPDNAARIVRLGVGRTLSRSRYKADGVARELRQLLEDPGYAQRAAALGAAVRAEEGSAAACDRIEQLLG